MYFVTLKILENERGISIKILFYLIRIRNVAYLFLRTIAYNFRSGVVSRSECKHGNGENRDTRGLLSVFIYCINFATVYFGNNSCGTLDRDTEGIRSV